MTTTITISRARLVLGTALAALCLGAAACGTETAAPAPSVSQAGGQAESRISPLTVEHQSVRQAVLLNQIRRLRAEEADARRWARDHGPVTRPHGSIRADTPCRRLRRSPHGSTTCAISPPL